MSEYFFLKTRRALSEENIKSIIAEAGYDQRLHLFPTDG